MRRGLPGLAITLFIIFIIATVIQKEGMVQNAQTILLTDGYTYVEVSDISVNIENDTVKKIGVIPLKKGQVLGLMYDEEGKPEIKISEFDSVIAELKARGYEVKEI